MDAASDAAIFATLRAQTAAHTILLVSHRAWTLRGVDQIHVMADGRIVQSGTFDELSRADGPFSELFKEQSWGPQAG